MSGTFSKIYIHVVFAVKNRHALIQSSWEEQLYKYITGIVQNKGQKMLAINGTSNHIHFLIGMKPSCCLSDLVREIKKSTNNFIKENKYTNCHFAWQEGFGSFSYGHSQISFISEYVLNQKEHHKNNTFREEYIKILNAFEVEYDQEYLFEWINNE